MRERKRERENEECTVAPSSSLNNMIITLLCVYNILFSRVRGVVHVSNKKGRGGDLCIVIRDS